MSGLFSLVGFRRNVLGISWDDSHVFYAAHAQNYVVIFFSVASNTSTSIGYEQILERSSNYFVNNYMWRNNLHLLAHNDN